MTGHWYTSPMAGHLGQVQMTGQMNLSPMNGPDGWGGNGPRLF